MADDNPGERCPTCGQVHKATVKGARPCRGHHSRNHAEPGSPCANMAMRGQDVCRAHGGAARQNRAAAAQRIAEADAEKVLRRFGEPVETTPSEALLDAVKWTAGYVAWLRGKVAEVATDEDLIWGVTRNKSGGEDRGTTEEAKPNAWLSLLGEWHDRLVKICSEAIRAGIEERRVQLAESQGELIVQVIRGILTDLQLTPVQEAKVAEVVPRHLRSVAAAS